jgi:disease resistance protein RPM1
LWIAEGFIEQRGSMNIDEVAESYLVELVHRSMLQVTERNSFGRIRRFRMHDLVRELAIKLSEKESFNSTYDDASGVIEYRGCIRLAEFQCFAAIKISN